MTLKNIYYINRKYYLRKRIYKKDVNYGIFTNKNEAIKQKKLLIKHNWIKSASTGYPPEERFPKYIIKKTDEYYIVFNKKNGKTYGGYKSCKYAQIIKKILPFYEDDIDIKQIESIAHKEYFKYIHYDELKDIYYVKYHGITRYSSKKLINVLFERDLIVKYDGDEELMCEDPTIVFDYRKDEIPEFFREVNNITEKNNAKNKYQIEKQIRNERIIIGTYPTYNLAILIRDYLKQNAWNEEIIKQIINVTDIIHKRDKFIHKHGNKFYIVHYKNSKPHIYAKYENKNMAQYIRTKLVNNNWNEEMIHKFEIKYYKENYETEYYYDCTDFFKAKS